MENITPIYENVRVKLQHPMILIEC